MRHSPRIETASPVLGEAHDSVPVLLLEIKDTEATHENCRGRKGTRFLSASRHRGFVAGAFRMRFGGD
ncbi:hypothetical protein CFBP5875_07605 [Agrobacterium pusense]|nr:hypothetical protein DBL06_21230 [Agrobacterium pusense]PZU78973.1 MAG: hypothetical protein DI546_01240 [Rhizobium sp.]QBJ13171.1 hypothetical protein EYD00_07070 [Agrobacterium sp. 33MFTa1.1]QSZ57046.1 hypothetical protein BTN45_07965 [Rhizobium sp. ZX09]RAL98551.1 hypothetical protein DOU54_05560 [Agrobacterium sp. MS2]RSC38419.1 hypothetical protein EGT36_15415 [Agrobacterium sp. FDAARGOS_525]TGR71462.1 hypothetical protein EN837_08625 [bacterium M00.F.Ca.ET.194.01.1.1]TGS56318.1 hypo